MEKGPTELSYSRLGSKLISKDHLLCKNNENHHKIGIGYLPVANRLRKSSYVVFGKEE